MCQIQRRESVYRFFRVLLTPLDANTSMLVKIAQSVPSLGFPCRSKSQSGTNMSNPASTRGRLYNFHKTALTSHRSLFRLRGGRDYHIQQQLANRDAVKAARDAQRRVVPESSQSHDAS